MERLLTTRDRLSRHKLSGSSSSGFTLIELLVVIAIIAVLLALSVPGTLKALQATQLAAAGDDIRNALVLAQQRAIAENREVEVRLYQFADAGEVPATPQFRALVSVIEDRTGKQILGHPTLISTPSYICTQPGLSTLTEAGNPLPQPLTQDPAPALYGDGSYAYVSFAFFPDGSTNLPANTAGSTGGTGDTWHLTIADNKTEVIGTSPSNYYTVRIDPFTGRAFVHRP